MAKQPSLVKIDGVDVTKDTKMHINLEIEIQGLLSQYMSSKRRNK